MTLKVADLLTTLGSTTAITNFMDLKDFYALSSSATEFRKILNKGPWWKMYLERYFRFLISLNTEPALWTRTIFEQQFKKIVAQIKSTHNIKEYINVFASNSRTILTLSYKPSLTFRCNNTDIRLAAYLAAIRQDHEQFSKLISQIDPLGENGIFHSSYFDNLLLHSIQTKQIEVLHFLLRSKSFMDTIQTQHVSEIIDQIYTQLSEENPIIGIICILARSPEFMACITDEIEENKAMSFPHGVYNTFMAIKDNEDLKAQEKFKRKRTENNFEKTDIHDKKRKMSKMGG